MPRLPDSDDLGTRQIRAVRDVPNFYTSQIGGAVAGAGRDIEAAQRAKEAEDDALDLMRARAQLSKSLMLEDQNYDLSKDQDYNTWVPRFDTAARKHADEAASGIRNPRTRERFSIEASDDIVRYGVRMEDRVRGVDRGYKRNALDESIDTTINAASELPDGDDEDEIAKVGVATEDAARTGIISPEEMGEKNRNALRRFAGVKYAKKALTDPDGAIYELTGRVVRTNPVLSHILQGVESGHRTDAESPVGASGLRQIMPDTARQIARELGDPNFPYKGSDAAVKAYLKANWQQNQRYGDHYLNQQLARYGGDLGLALAAYNAGPGRVDEFLQTGRPLPQETRDYVEKITKAYAKNVKGAPAYTAFLEPEDRLRLAGGAETNIAQSIAQQEKARREAEQQQRAALDQLRGDIELNIENGLGTEAEIMNSPLDNGAKADLLHSLRTKKADVDNMTNALGLMAQGLPVNPTEYKKGLDEIFRVAGGAKGIVDGNPATIGTLHDVWRNGQVMPSDAEASFAQMVRSSNNDHVARGMSMLDSFQRVNPTLFRNTFDDNTEDAVAYFQKNVPFMSPDEIVEGWRKRQDPSWLRQNEHLLEQGKKIAAKEWSADNILAKFAGWTSPDAQPSHPMVTDSEAALEADWSDLYAEGLMRSGGDKKEAEAFAERKIQKKWGVSDVNNGVFMAYPPEQQKAYQAIGGSHEWMVKQLDSDLRKAGYLYKTVGIRGAPKEVVRPHFLTPTANIEAEIAAGVPPSYHVIVMDEEGNLDVALDEKHNPMVYYWDDKGPRQKAQAEFAAKHQAAVKREHEDNAAALAASELIGRRMGDEQPKPNDLGTLAGAR